MSATVIYTRRSSGTEDDSTSLETQETDCLAFAASRGWADCRIYPEGVKSGVTIAERPRMIELLAEIEAQLAAEQTIVESEASDGTDQA